MFACAHDDFPPPPHGEHPVVGKEHPVVAAIAVIAIVVAIVLIAWARIEVLGTRDLQAALTEEGPAPAGTEHSEVDAAVTANRFATGLSP